ncbi:MAG: hypothetical protein ACI4WG_03680 [Erysipelotrichaceae bacterium]
MLGGRLCPYCLNRIKRKDFIDNGAEYLVTCNNCHREYSASKSKMGGIYLLYIFTFVIGLHILDFACKDWMKVWPIILFLIYVYATGIFYNFIFYKELKEVPATKE